MRLAIDTSTATTGLALIEGDNVPAEITWLCEQNHSVELLPHLTPLPQGEHERLHDEDS